MFVIYESLFSEKKQTNFPVAYSLSHHCFENNVKNARNRTSSHMLRSSPPPVVTWTLLRSFQRRKRINFDSDRFINDVNTLSARLCVAKCSDIPQCAIAVVHCMVRKLLAAVRRTSLPARLVSVPSSRSSTFPSRTCPGSEHRSEVNILGSSTRITRGCATYTRESGTRRHDDTRSLARACTCRDGRRRRGSDRRKLGTSGGPMPDGWSSIKSAAAAFPASATAYKARRDSAARSRHAAVGRSVGRSTTLIGINEIRRRVTDRERKREKRRPALQAQRNPRQNRYFYL
jgi:hypothetical protein